MLLKNALTASSLRPLYILSVADAANAIRSLAISDLSVVFNGSIVSPSPKFEFLVSDFKINLFYLTKTALIVASNLA